MVNHLFWIKPFLYIASHAIYEWSTIIPLSVYLLLHIQFLYMRLPNEKALSFLSPRFAHIPQFLTVTMTFSGYVKWYSKSHLGQKWHQLKHSIVRLDTLTTPNKSCPLSVFSLMGTFRIPLGPISFETMKISVLFLVPLSEDYSNDVIVRVEHRELNKQQLLKYLGSVKDKLISFYWQLCKNMCEVSVIHRKMLY